MKLFEKYNQKNKQFGVDSTKNENEGKTYIGLTKIQYEEYLKLKSKNECLHCGKDIPSYCENCYQELISKNAKLQFVNKESNYIPKQSIRDKIKELYEENEEWTKELGEPDSNFKNIDINLKRIKNQIEILEEILK